MSALGGSGFFSHKIHSCGGKYRMEEIQSEHQKQGLQAIRGRGGKKIAVREKLRRRISRRRANLHNCRRAHGYLLIPRREYRKCGDILDGDARPFSGASHRRRRIRRHCQICGRGYARADYGICKRCRLARD